MLWRLDHQEAVDISSIPDQDLLKLLHLTFDNLKLLKVKEVTPWQRRGPAFPAPQMWMSLHTLRVYSRHWAGLQWAYLSPKTDRVMPVSLQGVYVKAKKGESLLGQLGQVLDETPAEPSASTTTVVSKGQAAVPAQIVQEQIGNGESALI